MKKKLAFILVAVLAFGVFGIAGCGKTEEMIDLSKGLSYYDAIQSYSVSGNETTIKAKVNIATGADMEVTAVIAPDTTNGSTADQNAAFKTVTVSITGANKATYENLLDGKFTDTVTEEELDYSNNPKDLEGKAIRVMYTGATASASDTDAYSFVTDVATDRTSGAVTTPPADVKAVGIAASTAMEKIVGYYRYYRDLKAAYNGVKVDAKKVNLNTTYTSEVELHTASAAGAAVTVTNVWELSNSYIIVANSTSTSHGQQIMIMLEIGKDNKIKKAIAPLTHVSEYYGGNNVAADTKAGTPAINDVYLTALRANLTALVGVDISDKVFAAKGETGSITSITTKATLTTNVTTNAVNIIIDYYANVLAA